MPNKIKPNSINTTKVVYSLVQSVARLHAALVADVTNNSGGTNGAVVAHAVAFTDVAASGSNLADKTTSEAAFNTYKDALVELYAKANAIATACGIPVVTYNGGGTAADNTIAVVTQSVTGAATGIKAANATITFTAFNEAVYNLVVLVNRICVATGHSKITVATYKGKTVSTFPVIAVDGGTAASPGVTKAAVDAELVKAANSVATIATKLNLVNNGLSVSQFVAS